MTSAHAVAAAQITSGMQSAHSHTSPGAFGCQSQTQSLRDQRPRVLAGVAETYRSVYPTVQRAPSRHAAVCGYLLGRSESHLMSAVNDLNFALD